MAKKIKNLVILARRWNDRKYGNTYHSVKVYVNMNLIGIVKFRYGYEQAFMQTAFDIVQKNNYWPNTGKQLPSGFPKDEYDFEMWLRENRGKVIVDVADVCRKKDL